LVFVCVSLSLVSTLLLTHSLLGSCADAMVRAACQRLDLHREPLARSWHVANDLAQLFFALSSLQRPVDRDARRSYRVRDKLHRTHRHRLGGDSRCPARVAGRRWWCRVVHEAKPFVRLRLSNVARLSLSCGRHLRQQALSPLLHSHSPQTFNVRVCIVYSHHSCNEPASFRDPRTQ